MCLILKPHQTPERAIKIAEKDITCYKILKSYTYTITEDNNEVLKSLYQNFEYAIGRTYQRKPELGLGFRVGYDDMHRCYFYEVHEAFHSYKNEETALWQLYEYASRSYMRLVAVKCTIPKGSEYVENDCYYASDSIILNKIISEYRHKLKVI